MATNKSKDAAALFELIDKSTLKVPKDGRGALKIPSWWSSKTNPPPPPPPSPPPQPPLSPSPMSVPVSSAPAESVAVTSRTEDKPPTGPVAAAAGSQAALPGLEAREQLAAPSSAPPSPSFRPPPPSPPVVPSSPRAGGTMPARRNASLFAPQSIDPAAAARGPLLSRIPIWALVGSSIGAVAIVGLVIWFAVNRGSVRGAEASSSGASPGGTTPLLSPSAGIQPRITRGSDVPTLPSGARPIADGAQRAGAAPGRAASPATPVPTTPARIWLSTEVKRSPDLLYLIIYTGRTVENARENAKFLADRGVNVSVEEMKRSGGSYFCVVSVDGFAKRADAPAAALKARVIEIGHQHPDFKKRGKGVYDDPYYAKVVRAPA